MKSKGKKGKLRTHKGTKSTVKGNVRKKGNDRSFKE
jgi:hypothetical protein